jgi:hypothetical protein
MANLPQKRGGCTLLVRKQLLAFHAVKPWADNNNNQISAIATTENVWGYDTFNSGASVGWANTNSANTLAK